MVCHTGPEKVSSPFIIMSESLSLELYMNGGSPHSLKKKKKNHKHTHIVQVRAPDCMWVCACAWEWKQQERSSYSMYMMTPMLHKSHCWLYSWPLITSGAERASPRVNNERCLRSGVMCDIWCVMSLTAFSLYSFSNVISVTSLTVN